MNKLDLSLAVKLANSPTKLVDDKVVGSFPQIPIGKVLQRAYWNDSNCLPSLRKIFPELEFKFIRDRAEIEQKMKDFKFEKNEHDEWFSSYAAIIPVQIHENDVVIDCWVFVS